MILTTSKQGNILRVGMHISFTIVPGSFISGVLQQRLEKDMWIVTNIEKIEWGDFFTFKNVTSDEQYRDPFSNIGSSYNIVIHNYEQISSNKGRKECWQCGCNTEQRRDFSDMSIREFCPRCKI